MNSKRRTGQQWIKRYNHLRLNNIRGWEVYAKDPSDFEQVKLAFRKKKITEKQFQVNLCYSSVEDAKTGYIW